MYVCSTCATLEITKKPWKFTGYREFNRDSMIIRRILGKANAMYDVRPNLCLADH